MIILRIGFTCVALTLLSASVGKAALIRYEFTGALIGGSTGTYNLFGVMVPKNATVAGRFHYETDTLGIEIEAGTRIFKQRITSGYELDINEGAIRLSASDYVITLANDFGTAPSLADQFSADFDSRFIPAPSRLVVNGLTWTGATAFMKFALSWPSSTFEDADEPKLTSTRPLVLGADRTAFVGSSSTPRFFTIDTISLVIPEPKSWLLFGVCILTFTKRLFHRNRL
jgi:hypothetical protein